MATAYVNGKGQSLISHMVAQSFGKVMA